MRLFDILVSLLCLILAAPLLAVCALAIAIETGRPVIYGCTRLGKGGVPFTFYKLRTMYQGSPYLTYAKGTHDPRVTKVGYWLRRFSLDELPQLWNVLKGDMAVYGPRPWLSNEAIGPYAADILSVKPGLINAYVAFGRSELTDVERLQLDAKFARRMNWKQCVHATVRLIVRLVDQRGAR